VVLGVAEGWVCGGGGVVPPSGVMGGFREVIAGKGHTAGVDRDADR
jgi:hypothetical protein